MSDAFDAALEAQFATLGVSAVLDPDGVARPVRVIPSRPDEVTPFGSARIVSETAIFDILAAAFDGFGDGAVLEVGAERRRVRSWTVPDRLRRKRRLDTIPE